MKTILKFKPRGQTYLFVVCFAVLCITAVPTSAAMYGFTAITNNNDGNGDLFAAQLSLEVTDAGAIENPDETLTHQVLFTFTNSLGDFTQGAIAEIYFADGTLLGIADIINDPLIVYFEEDATPKDLPGGDTLDPLFTGEHTTALFSAEESLGGNWASVDPGESVGILFNLVAGKDFANVLAAIGLGFTTPSLTGSLRIGLHVQEIGGASSDSFILTPVPGAVLLGLLGLSIAGIKLRRFTSEPHCGQSCGH